MQFKELPLCSEILRAVDEMGFTEATDIQAEAIPPILEGHDLIGRSSTGTGKTAAFGIPAVEMASRFAEKATVLILCPTRELAVQSVGELRKFGKYMQGVSTAVLYGGASMETQIFQLKTARIVIGTPGRVMDHLRRRTLRLDNLRCIVLDEADEMLNMGFIDDIRTILESAPAQRQTVLFSATMPTAIVKISEEFQTEPVKITVDGGRKTASGIEQSYYSVPQAGKTDALKLLLEYHRPKRALVFCNTKKMVDELCEDLCACGFRALGLHGDLKQAQRNSVMREFKTGQCNLLVATDVAARGLDVDDVEAVFNYDIPQEFEYYIHRIGRTGRAGKAGASYTLAANRNQFSRIHQIERYIGSPIQEKPVPTVENIQAVRQTGFIQEIKELVDGGAGAEWTQTVAALSKEGYDPAQVAAALCAKLQKKTNRLAKVRNIAAPGGKRPQVSAAGRTWVRADIGSDARIAPNFIVGAITEASGIPSSAIGKINIYADHTDVDLASEDAAGVLKAMVGVRIKGQEVHFQPTAGGRTESRGHGAGERCVEHDYSARRGGPARQKKWGKDTRRDAHPGKKMAHRRG